MRVIFGLLVLATGFGLAALWQTRRAAELQAARASADGIALGTLAETPSGLVPDGWGVVIVGRPAGSTVATSPDASASVEHAPAPEPVATEPQSAPGVEAWQQLEQRALADFELEVQPGQSLYRIAQAHYGQHSAELLDALARYNSMASPDELQAGAKLRLPSIEKLGAAQR